MHEHETTRAGGHDGGADARGTPGRRTLTAALPARTSEPVQRTAAAAEPDPVVRAAQVAAVQRLFDDALRPDLSAGVSERAAAGVAGGGGALPHQAAIQRSFGRHDVGGIEAHVGGAAAGASAALGAEAYATGNHV